MSELLHVFCRVHAVSERMISLWVKNNAKWLSDDQISDDDFVQLIQYFIKKSTIQV